MPKKKWLQKEQSDAELLKARPTPRSGGLWFAKGDSKSDKFLIENKTTDKENFTINGKVWQKINNEAIINSRIPLLSVMFGKKETEVIVIEKNDFMEIIDNLEQAQMAWKDLEDNR